MQQHIKIIAVGKLKEPFNSAYLDTKKQADYTKIRIIEISDEDCQSKSEQEVLKIEGEKILKHVLQEDYVIALAIEGEIMDSFELKTVIKNNNRATFIIGGSLGLGMEVKKRADRLVSFSALTFPHQLMRIILLDELMH